jgi:lysophospholipase L1-like esterase
MKTSKKILFSLALFILLIGVSLIFSLAVSPKDKVMAPDTPGFYRPGTIAGLPHEHVPGMTGTLNGVSVRINSYGFRGPDFEHPKRKGVKRIVVFGDSVVFGQGIVEDSTISSLLRNELDSKYKEADWEVINAGVRGYNIIDYKAVFDKRILSLDPDIVIFIITEINDLQRSEFVARSEQLEKWKSSWWTNNSVTRPLMAGAWAKEINRLFIQHVSEIYAMDGESWPLFKTDMKEIVSSCKINDVSIIVVSFPFLDNEDVFVSERKQLHTFFNEIEVPWIDPLPEYRKQKPQNLVVSKSDFHPNKEANRILADILFDKIKQLSITSPDQEQ